jgi:hypothetical protein
MRRSKMSNTKKNYYSYEKIVSAIMDQRNLDEKARDSIRSVVKNSFKVLGKYWGGLEPLIEFVQSELVFERVVKIISDMESDRSIKAIITKSVANKKLNKEECEKINKIIIEILKVGKSKEQQEKIELEYKVKQEKLQMFREIEKQMNKRFKNEYRKYINEVLNKEFKLEKFKTEEHVKEIERANEEIVKMVQQKVNEILYSNEFRRIQCEALERQELYNEKIDFNKLIEEVQKIAKKYNVDSEKDIYNLKFSLMNTTNN